MADPEEKGADRGRRTPISSWWAALLLVPLVLAAVFIGYLIVEAVK